MALGPAAILAFVSTAIMARMGGEGGEPTPPQPKEPEPAPEVKEPAPEEADEPEPEPEEEDKTAALRREVEWLRTRILDLCGEIANERDRRIELTRRLDHTERTRDQWATLYMNSQALQADVAPGAQQQLQARQLGVVQQPLRGGYEYEHRLRDLGHRNWGLCTCVPGRADALRHRIDE